MPFDLAVLVARKAIDRDESRRPTPDRQPLLAMGAQCYFVECAIRHHTIAHTSSTPSAFGRV